MISKESFNYAIRNLLNRKLRASLTILSIFVGISTIFIFISFGWGLFFYMEELSVELGVDKIFVQAKGIGAPGTDATFKLLQDDLEVIEKTRGIEQVVGIPFTSAKTEKNNKILYSYMMGMPVDDDEELAFITEFLTVDIINGKELASGDDTKVTLGYNFQVPNRLYEKPLKLGDKLKINDINFKVAGFYDEIGNPSDDANIYITLDAFKELTGEDDINFGFVAARVDDVDDMDEIIERAERRLRKHRGLEEGKEDFTIESYDAIIESFKGAFNIVIGFIVLIALISVIVSAVNTANTMFTSILERTNEIGILKAIGARNSEILMIFLLESGIQGLIAGIIGVLVGLGISYVGGLALDAVGYSFLDPYFPPVLFIGCILFATAIGTVSGMLPAYQASRKNPVDSLRYE